MKPSDATLNPGDFHLLDLEPHQEEELLNTLTSIRKYTVIDRRHYERGCWEWVKNSFTRSGLASMEDKPNLSIATRMLRRLSGNPSIVGFPLCGNVKCVRPGHLASAGFAERYLKKHGFEPERIKQLRARGELLKGCVAAHAKEEQVDRCFRILKLHWEDGWGYKRIQREVGGTIHSVQRICRGEIRRREFTLYWRQRQAAKALEVALAKEAKAKHNSSSNQYEGGFNITRRSHRERPTDRVRAPGTQVQSDQGSSFIPHEAGEIQRTSTGRRISTIGMPQSSEEM